MNETLILSIDPFAGDFGGTDDKLFSDRFVTSAKFHVAACNICCEDIVKTERHRVIRQKFDGEMRTYRFCYLCCVATEQEYGDPESDALEARVKMQR